MDELCVNTIRFLAVDAVEKANSGHPGMPLGAAPMAYVLWTRFLKHDPKDPQWPDRDRFILSAGHGSALLYALLHLTGYNVTIDDLKNFRQYGSITPGHPEHGLTSGVEATTGPLGQGFAMGVGMALAERFLSTCKNVGHYTYAIVSDGDLMEGVSSEAASFAGNQKLGKLIYLYDNNHISIEGNTEIAFTEDPSARFKSYGWHVQEVKDGNDLNAIENAIRVAQEEKEKPSLISVRTHIGFGSPKQDNASSHGEPLGEKAMKATREFFGWTHEPFHVPEEVKKYFLSINNVAQTFRSANIGRSKDLRYEGCHHVCHPRESGDPEHLNTLDSCLRRNDMTSEGTQREYTLPKFEAGKSISTRAASGKIMNEAAKMLPTFIGGSADLAPSNKTSLDGMGSMSFENPAGRNIHFGVREHAMGAIVNGMALHGGVIPYGATFLTFSDYMRPSIRLAALMNIRSIFIFTHDSVGLGEDGPTHQPVEQLASLRAIPNLTVIRPCDANETAEAWECAIESDSPVAIVLSRQELPVLDRNKYAHASGAKKGAYILADSKRSPDLVIIATGSEVHLALSAKDVLDVDGIETRVVSMPSWELFEKQPESYRNSVLPPEVKTRIAVEAGVSFGWHRFVGSEGHIIGIDRFGTSAPGQIAMEKLGMTVARIVSVAN